MKKVGVLISGRGSNLQALIDAQARLGAYEIALVVSNVADAGGLARAEAAGIATRMIEHRAFGKDRERFERAIDAILRAAGIEIVALAGFMRVLTPYFVNAWRDKILNIHPSLLPAFPGRDTHARALEAGVKLHGCTVHLVREAVDDGPILGQAAIAVTPEDTPESLAARLLPVEHALYPLCLAAFAGGNVQPAAFPLALNFWVPAKPR
ncbi:MAG: phosphoribosylglycinamide formyltransferase [Hydrogenophilaceae bacterium]|jgi:phosphoribosylglycinamide formyltransferase-1|nr:phosphoribosylglycinamide formyltransferase [Hydrogenophilaceae bacterium]